MFADEVSPRNTLFVFVRRNRQWPHTGIGVENAIARKAGARQSKIGLSEQVVDFPGFAPDLIRVTFKANVRRSNQIKLVPRNDKDGPPVAACLQVDRIRQARVGNGDTTR